MYKGNENIYKKGTETGTSALGGKAPAKLLFVFIRKWKRINEQSWCLNEPITGCREFLLHYAKNMVLFGFFPPVFQSLDEKR